MAESIRFHAVCDSVRVNEPDASHVGVKGDTCPADLVVWLGRYLTGAAKLKVFVACCDGHDVIS
jgi:hypothetical protein